MPIYEYRCERCGEVFEKLQKFSDTPLKKHEGCGGAVERLISPAAFHFKGTGWYVTDYAHKNGCSPAPTEHHNHNGNNGNGASHNTETAAKPKPKTESKPA